VVKRRSLDDALTPEEELFLAGNAAKTSGPTPRPKKTPGKRPQSKPKTQKENVPMTKPALKELPPEPISAPPEGYALPSLVGLNTRIESNLSNALLRASMERRIARHPTAKVQDIVGQALAEWLKKHGYLK